MATTTSPNAAAVERLPVNISRLELGYGSNWAIFQMRFKEVMRPPSTGGTSVAPSRPSQAPANPDKDTAAEKEGMEKWNREDFIAHYLLSQGLPDTTAIHLSHYSTTSIHWNKVRVTGNTSACAHVLCGIHEELAKFAASIMSSAHIAHGVISIDTDTVTLIDHICEEADRLKNRRMNPGQNSGDRKKDGHGDEALAATGSEGKKKRRMGKYHNCDEPGHRAREDRAPKEGNTTGQTGQAAQTSPGSSAIERGITPTSVYGFWVIEEVVPTGTGTGAVISGSSLTGVMTTSYCDYLYDSEAATRILDGKTPFEALCGQSELLEGEDDGDFVIVDNSEQPASQPTITPLLPTLPPPKTPAPPEEAPATPDVADPTPDSAAESIAVHTGTCATGGVSIQGLEYIFVAETAMAEALELRTLAKAKRRPDWLLWEKAIKEDSELDTLHTAWTWRLEEAPPGANIIGGVLLGL
ncbi:hypothetical protein BJV78DRAFT_1155924 [Lactifluus subvellereus]|nr:hypothetical protein BJV78DRAFT_1155924 [Lactifluus subvellereus]